MLEALDVGREGYDIFIKTHPEVLALSRIILKREWNRVKDEIPMT